MPAANVTIGKVCEPFRVEMVIRGYLAGSAWRAYKNGRQKVMRGNTTGWYERKSKFENQLLRLLPKPMSDTMMKKFRREDIIARGIVSKEDYE